MTTKQDARKMFDEIFLDNISLSSDAFQKVYSKLHLIPAIHKFIDQMIDKAVEEREKEIVEMIKANKRQTKGLAQYGMGYDDALADCINLIKKIIN